ncbi:MAG: hypothetical protein ACP5QI_03470 [Candidatus Bathyarchaeia archaeon]
MFHAFKALIAGSGDPYSTALEMFNGWRSVLAEMAVAGNIAHMIISLEAIHDVRLLERKIFYYKPRAGREIDFLIDVEIKLIPIEVYSGSEVDDGHVRKLAELSRQLKTRRILAYLGKKIQADEYFIAVPAPILMLIA